MSNEIYYDRAFIKIGDSFIPMVNHGSSNTFEFNFCGREIAEKGWHVLNYLTPSKFLFTKDEICDIAEDYERISKESRACYKTRNSIFKVGEFKRWILCGLNSAYTIEEYSSFGNGFEILDWSSEEYKRYPFSTTEEFLELLETFPTTARLNVLLTDSRNVYRPKNNKGRIKDFRLNEAYYVLCYNTSIYFCKLKKRGYMYTKNNLSSSMRTFETEKDAQKYLEKHPNKLKGFTVKEIEKCVDEKIA